MIAVVPRKFPRETTAGWRSFAATATSSGRLPIIASTVPFFFVWTLRITLGCKPARSSIAASQLPTTSKDRPTATPIVDRAATKRWTNVPFRTVFAVMGSEAAYRGATKTRTTMASITMPTIAVPAVHEEQTSCAAGSFLDSSPDCSRPTAAGACRPAPVPSRCSRTTGEWRWQRSVLITAAMR
jgi:hypothetical protein